MRRKPFDGIYLGAYLNFLSVDADDWIPIQKSSAARFLGLVTHDDHSIFFIGEVVEEMV